MTADCHDTMRRRQSSRQFLSTIILPRRWDLYIHDKDEGRLRVWRGQEGVCSGESSEDGRSG